MKEKDKFGELSARIFDIGDIVEWSTWNREINDWDSHYGIVIDIKNEIKSGRLVSISTVKPVAAVNLGERSIVKIGSSITTDGKIFG